MRRALVLVSLFFACSLFGQNLEIHYIDVGWGNSVLVKGPNGTTVLMDAGDTGKGTAYVVPYLKSISIQPANGLDYTIVSHQHCDHLGGMDEVVSAGYNVHTKNYYNGSTNTSSCVTGWNSAAATTTAGSPIAMPVGAVIVREKMILTTGYNGSIRGLGHCDDEGHLMEEGHCVRTVHAEANAIVQAARNGVRLDGADIYVTASPCFGCYKLIANSGLTRIVFGESYRDSRIFELSEKLGIKLDHLPIEGVPREAGAEPPA